VEEAEQPSDIEEGGLDLSVSLKPISFYITDKREMLQQCFCVIGEKKLQKMLPDILKVLKYPYLYVLFTSVNAYVTNHIYLSSLVHFQMKSCLCMSEIKIIYSL